MEKAFTNLIFLTNHLFLSHKITLRLATPEKTNYNPALSLSLSLSDRKRSTRSCFEGFGPKMKPKVSTKWDSTDLSLFQRCKFQIY